MYISSFSFPSTRSTILAFLVFYVECITIHHLVPVKFKHMLAVFKEYSNEKKNTELPTEEYHL